MSTTFAGRIQYGFFGPAGRCCSIGRLRQITGPAQQTAQTEAGTLDHGADHKFVVVILRPTVVFSSGSPQTDEGPSFYNYQKRFFPIYTARKDPCDSATAGNTLDLRHSIFGQPKGLSSDQRTPKATREFAVVFISNYVADLGEIWRAD